MFKWRSSKNTTSETVYPTGKHAPDTFPASCLGEQCPNFRGSHRENSFYEWIGANATACDNREFNKPPFLNEAIYVSYGQICIPRFQLEMHQ